MPSMFKPHFSVMDNNVSWIFIFFGGPKRGCSLHVFLIWDEDIRSLKYCNAHIKKERVGGVSLFK